ncbi:Uncharacterised protein [Mycobacteroides abscessus subsp. abscessus]|nr:Uncharacterised protein [Mycobacteroides abscessus subsp. abscessus]SKO51928.1 Uncharacterised protein [Mycobacteroides abscessus subsp. abscessus]
MRHHGQPDLWAGERPMTGPVDPKDRLIADITAELDAEDEEE